MKPQNIFLIRHGESEGNVNKDIYKIKPDYALLLTKKGMEDACNAGNDIKKIVGEKRIIATYFSPMFRAHQTIDIIIKNNEFTTPIYREDARLREQEWGNLREDVDYEDIQNKRDNYGHFYYRLPYGESCADVFDRISSFLNTLHRDFQKENFPQNCLISTHGMSMRCIIARWYHMTVEEFELLANPKNGEVWNMNLNENGKYDLITKIKKYKSREHNYQYPGI